MLEPAGSNERRLAGIALKESAAARFTLVPGLPTLLLRIVRRDIVSVTACVRRCSVNGFSGSPGCCAGSDPRVMHWICGPTSGALYTSADYLAANCQRRTSGILILNRHGFRFVGFACFRVFVLPANPARSR